MMTQEQIIKLRKSLIAHEGLEHYPYVDSMGKITIGIGYNLSARGIDIEWINKQFNEDVSYFYKQLCEFPWYHLLNEDRQIVLIDMAFMGWKRFLEFETMLKALEKRDYDRAAREMLESRWASEVGDRAKQLAEGMRTGVYDV
jgi:lysozyme